MNGQREVHFEGGLREVVYPDSTCFKIFKGCENRLDVNNVSPELKQPPPVVYSES